MMIREAKAEDLQQMLAIYNDVIRETTAVYEYEPQTPAMRQLWWEGRKQQNLPVFVAEEEGKILGFSSFGPFRAWAAYQFTAENSVYVASEGRGRGIGKRLLAPLIEAARQRGLHTLIAGIDASNEASLRLHRHFGFEEVAHLRQVGWKFDRWLDLKLMQLIL